MAGNASVGTVYIEAVYDLEDLGAKVSQEVNQAAPGIQTAFQNMVNNINEELRKISKTMNKEMKKVNDAVSGVGSSGSGSKSGQSLEKKVGAEISAILKKSNSAQKTIQSETKKTGQTVERVVKKTTTTVNTQTASAGNGIVATLGKIGKAALAAFAVRQVFQFGKECVSLGSDLSEVQNVVDTVFPSMRDQVNDWSKSLITTAGLSETMGKQFSGTFGTMAKAMGISEGQSLEMSKALTQLSGDVASFYNMDAEEAFTKLKGIFTGESEALKSLGVIMTQTALDQYALNQGLGKTTAKMTEQEKVLLRYQYVMSSLSAASGDFAKTSGGWANQTRMLTLQFQQLKATIGQGLINVLTPVLRVINALLARLQVLANGFARLTGKVFGQQAAESVGTVADSVVDSSAAMSDGLGGVSAAAGAAKEALGSLNIDQFNKLNLDSGSAGGGGGGGGAVSGVGAIDMSAFDIPKLDTTDQQNSVGKLSAKLGELWEQAKKNKYFSEMAQIIRDKWEEYGEPTKENIKKWASETRKTLGMWKEYIVGPVLEHIGVKFNELWDEDLKDFFENLMELLGLSGLKFSEFGIEAQKVQQFFVQTFGPGISKVFQWITDWIFLRIEGLVEKLDGFVTVIRGLLLGDLTMIAQGFKQAFVAQFKQMGIDIEGIFEKIKSTFTTNMSALKNVVNMALDATVNHFRSAANGLISMVNRMISAVCSGVNTVIRALNSIKINIPGIFGGGSFSVNIRTISAPQIPMLAEGGYVKPNTPQLAMIGDNRTQGEIVTPEDKMYSIAKQAANDANAETNRLLRELIQVTKENKPIDRPVVLDGREVTKTVNKENQKNNIRKGK